MKSPMFEVPDKKPIGDCRLALVDRAGTSTLPFLGSPEAGRNFMRFGSVIMHHQTDAIGNCRREATMLKILQGVGCNSEDLPELSCH